MKGVPLFLFLALECCRGGTAPPTTLTAAQVAAELEDAGCLAQGPGVVDAVAAEMATGHDAWMTCMAAGGSIGACGAPCSR